MSAINEAYRVLGDDARRAAYDRQLRSVAVGHDGPSFVASSPNDDRAPPGAGPARADPVEADGRMAAIGITVVLIGAALREPDVERPPDGVVGPGSCVVIESNDDAREVNCTGAGDLVVAVVVAFDGTCPTGTDPHRDRQGLGIACVIPESAP